MANTPHPLAEAIPLTEELGQLLRAVSLVTIGQLVNQEKSKSHKIDASVMKEMMQQ